MAVVKNDNWIRRFEVSDPKKHKNGFTVYKVTSVVFPKSAPEASTSVVVWKRYNDFKKLYKSLKHYHKQCKISEELPQLCKGKFFKRFEENVIKDRINFARELLSFIGRHQILFTSDPFLQFFSNGYQIIESNCNEDGKNEMCINGNNLDSSSDQFLDCDSKERNWDSRSSNESISINTECSDEDSILTSDTANSVSPIHSVDSLFSKEKIRDSDNCNCNVVEAAFDVAEHSASLLNEGKVVQGGKENDPRKASPSNRFDGIGETVTCHSEKPIKPVEICLSVRTEDFRSVADSSVASAVTDGGSWFSPIGDISGRQDYLVEAAYHVGQAQKYEAEEEFEAAFCFYKAAIACLLSGVQDDEDRSRRQAVREKTSQYLHRAEKIYALHLASEREIGSKLTEALEDLKSFKVLRVIDSVMLVHNTSDNKQYILKVLQKSSCPVDLKKKTTIPYDVPYMVKLVKYFENVNSIFLVLEYVSGGKLWDHLNEYSRSSPFWNSPDEGEFYSCSSYSSQYEIIDLEKNEEESCDAVDGSREVDAKVEVCLDSCMNTPSPSVESPKKSDGWTKKILDSEILAKDEVEVSDLERFEVGNLVENSQRLLNSVKRTLENSEKLTSNLNKELIDIETIFDLKCGFVSSEKNSSHLTEKYIKKRSRSAASKPKFERSFSTENLSSSRSRTASNSVDRRKEWSNMSSVTDSPRLPESLIRRWAAELLVALETLHRQGIICKDLHPGNILLGDEGHILLTFQAYWHGVDSLISQDSISGLYVAPENMSVFPITSAADWWSFGALLHHLLTGKSLSSCYPEGILGHTILTFPDFLSPEACSLLKELLRYEASERLGSGVNGSEEIKCHPFFNYVDWQMVYDRF